jgi:hypothetical protein
MFLSKHSVINRVAWAPSRWRGKWPGSGWDKGTGLVTFDAHGAPWMDKAPIAAYEDQQFAQQTKERLSTTFSSRTSAMPPPAG